MLASTRILLFTVFSVSLLYYLGARLYSREIVYPAVKEVIDPKRNYLEAALSVSIDGPYDPAPLRQKCADTKWRDGLIFSCDGLEGGVGNVRNIALNCVRYAIEAGAAFIVPKITARGTYNISLLKSEKFVTFDTFFDLPYFVARLQEDCPQMALHNSTDDLWNIPSIATPLELDTDKLLTEFIHRVVIKNPSKWRAAFDAWLTRCLRQTGRRKFSSQSPLRVNVYKPLFNFPTSYDPPDFSAHFGRIVRIHPQIRRVAATVLWALRQTYNIGINVGTGIDRDTYMGAHLRTDRDATAQGWKGYDYQAPRYIEQAVNESLALMYVACGNASDVQRLRDLAEETSNVSVVTKADLLTGPDLDALHALSWDQQGLVDFEVMLRSSSFGGIEQSTFAWNVALKRQLVSGRAPELALNGSVLGYNESFVDEYSTIYGDIWGFDGSPLAVSMWP